MKGLCKKYLLLLVVFLFSACSNKKPIEADLKELLALALNNKMFTKVENLLPQIRMTENSNNIIRLYLNTHSENLFVIEREVEYLKQFVVDMGMAHQAVLNEIMVWLYVNQVYRHEVSSPVRIIQREQLYLEPSNIDFKKCPDVTVDCAHEVRAKLLPLIDNEELTRKLKKMALKDPCVNLSSQLQGQAVANRCLRKSKEQLKIVLLPFPRFSFSHWLKIISSES